MAHKNVCSHYGQKGDIDLMVDEGRIIYKHVNISEMSETKEEEY